jgi:c-di-GMP-binding flagellar brake protein YcgR
MSASFLRKGSGGKEKGWRRRHPRHRADFPLTASALREDVYLRIRGRCSDIGHGGMGAVLTEELPPGEVLSLEFGLPAASTPEQLAVRAIVRYRQGFVHGLEFIGLSTEQQSAIDGFCLDLETVD